VRTRRIPALIVAAFLGAAFSLAPAAQASPASSVLYVDAGTASCSDSGPGSQAQPFCSIQAAANMVNPGQTVQITGGPYGPVTVTRSGTPSEPITFTGATPGTITPEIASTATQPAMEITNASDIVVSYLYLQHSAAQDGVDLSGSHDITLDRMVISDNEPSLSSPSGISIDGTSSHVTVSRSEILGEWGYGLRAETGAQQITVTTNFISYSGPSSTVNPAGGLALNQRRWRGADQQLC
jgi:hypothetical protein